MFPLNVGINFFYDSQSGFCDTRSGFEISLCLSSSVKLDSNHLIIYEARTFDFLAKHTQLRNVSYHHLTFPVWVDARTCSLSLRVAKPEIALAPGRIHAILTRDHPFPLNLPQFANIFPRQPRLVPIVLHISHSASLTEIQSRQVAANFTKRTPNQAAPRIPSALSCGMAPFVTRPVMLFSERGS